MNKEYLASLDVIREHFQKEGVISLKEFFDQVPEVGDIQSLYQPADYRYEKATVTLNQLTIDFLENITDKKFEQVDVYLFSHKSFDLRKFFKKEGVFVVANISSEEYEDVGGEVFVIKDDEPLQIPTSINTITLINVSPEDESFVSYVNHHVDQGEIAYIMGLLS